MQHVNGAPAAIDGASSFKALSPIRRAALIAVGSIALVLGIIGAVVPGMPSTVFFLITIGCYARSSERLYRWLMTRTWLQKPMQSALTFKTHNAIPVRIKVIAQSVAWSSVIFLVFSGRSVFAQVLGVLFALSCTVAMALIKTLPDARTPLQWTLAMPDIGRQLGYGAVAGVLGGLIFGAAGRTIMRFVANLIDKPPLFNFAATIQMLVATAVLGLLIGLTYAGLRRFFPVNQWLRGIAFGVCVCFTIGTLLYAHPVMQADLLRVGAGNVPLVIALFIPNFVAMGLAISLIFGQLERRGTRAPSA
jgi:uncharacterized protein